MKDLHWQDIPAIAAMMRAGSLTPSDYLEHLLERIDRLDPALSAFVTLDREGAVAAADAAGEALKSGRDLGPLHGIPVAIKDVIDVAGLPTTCHSALRRNHVAATDAHVVARLRSAGAIILGKLSTHEFAIGGPAFDLPFPPARNPWNPMHHPGGSSSGAGAGVAAGMFPGAVGTDTAGSVRNPASACGIVGIKPTYGLVSRRGVFPLAFSLDHVGLLARSLRETALLLDAVAGHDPDDPGSVASPVSDLPFGLAIGRGVRGLRIGVVRHFHESDMTAEPEMAAAFEGVVAALQAEGAVMKPVTLPSLADFANVAAIILQSEAFSIHGADLRSRPGDYSALTRKALLPGAFLSAEDLVGAMRRRSQMIKAVDAAFAEIDILLCASSMETACRIDSPAEIARTYMLQARSPFNVTGHPALAMMSGLSSTGLPLSVQFAARAFDEATLFRVAAFWEKLKGGPVRPPI